jgi:ferrochelatase
VVVLPIGFLSDHLEVLYDLDVEAQEKAHGLGLNLVRAATVGIHPQFVAALADLVEERVNQPSNHGVAGAYAAWPDVCPEDCCPAPPPG